MILWTLERTTQGLDSMLVVPNYDPSTHSDLMGEKDLKPQILSPELGAMEEQAPGYWLLLGGLE
jgi:hypothetical protein